MTVSELNGTKFEKSVYDLFTLFFCLYSRNIKASWQDSTILQIDDKEIRNYNALVVHNVIENYTLARRKKIRASNEILILIAYAQKVSEYDQVIPQSQTADQPTAV